MDSISKLSDLAQNLFNLAGAGTFEIIIKIILGLMFIVGFVWVSIRAVKEAKKQSRRAGNEAQNEIPRENSNINDDAEQGESRSNDFLSS